MDELEPAIKIGVAANLARYYSAEGHDLLLSLAGLLQEVLGERTQIHRAGGFLAQKHLVGFAFTLGEWRFSLDDVHGALSAKRTHFVRGIALKSEDVPVAAWLEEVGAALEAEAQHNQAARDALSKWVD